MRRSALSLPARPIRLLHTVLAAILLIASGVMTVSLTSSSAVATHPTACNVDPDTPKRQFRAMWISSVANIDWPSRTGLSVSAQQAEFRAWLDLAEAHNLNAVVVQVRPTADAFWPSPYEPWSHWLTGTQGQSPGYDPLAFMVQETHARNLEFHAWFNPYRVATHADRSRLHSSHPVRQHPDWAFAYNGQLYYNPGIPAVRQHVRNAIMHAVDNYDIDGVHFDDYFYPYPASGVPIPDEDTYAQYGGGFNNIHDWRRNNVDLLVQELDQAIHQSKPWVKFGISPFGIWRNSSTDPRGSNTNGLQSYDAIYADSRKWVLQEWVDYIAPQVYWHIGYGIADYAVLVPWWSDVVSGTDVHLYIGQATYRAGASGQDQAWQNPAELSNHLYLNRSHPQVLGDIHFSAKDVRADRIGAMSRLSADHYSRPALVPVASQLGGSAPPTPTITSATRTGSGVELSWQGSGNATYYAVYRVNGSGATDPCAFVDAGNLLATVRGTSYTDPTADPNGTYTYHVAALDRRHHESSPSAGRTVGSGGGGGYNAIVDTTTPGRFTASGNWGTSSWSSEKYGPSYRFADPVSASDPAWFRFNIPQTGSYRVQVWYPSNAGYNASTPYLINTTTGNQTVRVDQRTNGGQWVDLGVFTLAGGDHNVVGVSRWTAASGYVIADAVRITSA